MTVQFKRGQIVAKPSYREIDLEAIEQYLRQPVSKLLKSGFPTGIMAVQLYGDKFPNPWWRMVHVEMVIDRDPRNDTVCPDDEVWTTSQEEIIKIRKRKKAHFIAGMGGDRPEYILLDPKWEIDDRFWDAVELKIDKSMSPRNLWGIYDIGEIVMHVINPVVNFFRGIFGKPKHHYSWTEMRGKYVCTSWIATLIQNGFEAMNWSRDYFWPRDLQWYPRKNADVKPAHFGITPRLKRIMEDDNPQ
jgi:hypothetical protein